MTNNSYPSTRAAAKEIGAKHYYSGKPCLYGHNTRRLTSTGVCLGCKYEENRSKSKNVWGFYPKGIGQKQREKIYRKKRYKEDANYRQKQIDKSNKYRINNPEKRREYLRNYNAERLKNDELFALKKTIRRRVYMAFQKAKKSKSNRTIAICGADWIHIKSHIESMFLPGMSWSNHGRYGWHIDHIIPLASAKSENELIALFHWTNLQPLWASDNIRKGSK